QPERDGPPHVSGMDHCEGSDPLVARNFTLATTAATALMEIAMDPSKTSDAKLAAVDALTAQYLTYQPGCDFSNNYCDAPEAKVVAPSTGCSASGAGAGWLVMIAIAAAVLRRRRLVVVASCAIVGSVAAQPAPGSGSGSGSAMPGPVVTDAPPDAPAVPVTPDKPADAAAVQQGHEPGRDVKTPTVTEVEKIREDKQLGSPLGAAFMIGGSFVHGALATAVGARYRLTERWTLGLDVEWNPWITSVPLALKAGAGSVYGTVIRRYPMKLDRVNLRTTLSLGASTLLFDVAGAPKYDIGPYVALSPLGIDYDFGGGVRLVFDPLAVSVPVPHIGLIPLYYEQFRTMIGIQIGG
ncbi:MAG TPA: MYXO-CTERM sorting domain-containing protein, partial [Kofleriaceae bacterium]